MTQLKSLAHPEWPYTGTVHEWRGFVKDLEELAKQCEPLQKHLERCGLIPRADGSIRQMSAAEFNNQLGLYQKQNFGPELT